MPESNKAKLNQVLLNQLHSKLLTSEWLKNKGIARNLTWWYVNSGWLEHVTDKVYKKTSDCIEWQDIISALQEQLGLPIHIGGKSALQLLGKSHYLPLSNFTSLDLFTPPGISVPRWVNKSSLWGTTFNIIKKQLFFTGERLENGLTTQIIERIPLKLSAPERAMLEVFYQVPKSINYEESLELMENLPYLRPKIVEALLKACTSIRAKRLFLHSAEKFQHEWFNDLNLKDISLGKGKLKIGEGGSYDAKYLLSLPKIRDNL